MTICPAQPLRAFLQHGQIPQAKLLQCQKHNDSNHDQDRDRDHPGKERQKKRDVTAENALNKERAKMEHRQRKATGEEAHCLYRWKWCKRRHQSKRAREGAQERSRYERHGRRRARNGRGEAKQTKLLHKTRNICRH